MESLLSSLTSGNSVQAVQALQTSGASGLFAGITLQTLIVGGIVSIIGMMYLSIGKRTSNMLMLFCGILLCVIPYFLYNVWYLGGVSLLIALLPIAKK